MQRRFFIVSMAGIRVHPTVICFLWFTLVLFGVVPLPGMAAEREGKADARRHFEAGLILVEKEKLEAAAMEFEASIELHPTPSALFNLANCYEGTHQYDKALVAFSKLRVDYAKTISPAVKEAIERHVRDIQNVVAELDIVVTPVGATIWVDGRNVGTSPLGKNLRVGPGRRRIKASFDGYQSEQLEISLLAEETKSISLDLKPSQGELLISSNVDGSAIFVNDEKVGVTPRRKSLFLEPGNYVIRLEKKGYTTGVRRVALFADKQRSLDVVLMPILSKTETRRVLSPWSWLGVGTTVATAAAGGAFFIIADQRYDDFTNTKKKIEDKTARWSSEEKNQLLLDQRTAADDVKRYSGLGLGFSIGTGVLLVTTAIFISRDLKKDKGQSEKMAFSPGEVTVNF